MFLFIMSVLLYYMYMVNKVEYIRQTNYWRVKTKCGLSTIWQIQRKVEIEKDLILWT